MHPLHLVSSVHGVLETYLFKTTLFREVGSYPKSKVINLGFKHYPNFVQILVHDREFFFTYAVTVFLYFTEMNVSPFPRI